DLGERDVLDVEGVDQLGEARGKAQGLGRAGAVPCEARLWAVPGPGLDETGEDEATLEFTDGGRNVRRVDLAIDFILVERAEDADSREEAGAAGLTEKTVGQSRLGAARGEEEPPLRQLGRF